MANAIILGAPRLGLGTITIGESEVAAMPKSNLETDEPSDVCRINTEDPLKTYIHSTLDMPGGYYGTTFNVGGVGVVNHNLSLGATSRTLFLGTGAAGYVPTRMAPGTKTDVTGAWSGTVADIDEDPFSADSNKNTCVGASSLTPAIQYDFATPSAAPAVGADRQMMRVKVSWTGDPPSNLSVELRDGITSLGYLTYTTTGADPSVSSGDVLLMTWDAADLSTADGSGVNIRVECVLGAGGDDISIEAADWLCDSGLSAGSILWDSGWQAATYDVVQSGFGSTVAGTSGSAPTQTHLAWSSTGDVASVASVVTYFRDPQNSAGYIDVGCYVVGPVFQPALNRAYGELVGVSDLSVKKRTHGGQTFGSNRPRLRTLSLPLGELTTTEAHTLYERLYWRKGILSSVLVSLFPGDSTEGKHTTIWCTLENAGDLTARDESGYRQMAMTFVEKL